VTQTVALIGYGAIGSVLATGLIAARDGPRLVGVMVRPAQAEAVRAALPEQAIVTGMADLLALSPDLVVECAGQGAVREHAADILGDGADLMIASTGALAEPGLLERLAGVAKSNRRAPSHPGRSHCRAGRAWRTEMRRALERDLHVDQAAAGLAQHAGRATHRS
jgi:predicted dinucleotide-utilizing enzyme